MVIDSTVCSNMLVTIERKETEKEEKPSLITSAILMIENRGGDHKYMG